MDILRGVLIGIYVVICIALIAVVLMQESKTEGLGAIGGASSDNSYWNKNKSRSIEGKLEMLTKIFAALFIVISVVLNAKW